MGAEAIRKLLQALDLAFALLRVLLQRLLQFRAPRGLGDARGAFNIAAAPTS